MKQFFVILTVLIFSIPAIANSPFNLNIQVNKKAQGNLIVWESHPSDTYEFVIERSLDGIDFSMIGVVLCNQDEDGTENYQFLDKVGKASYYRVVAKTVSGNDNYSEVIATKKKGDFSVISGVTKSSNKFAFVIESNVNKEVELILTNFSGIKLWEGKTTIKEGINYQSLQFSQLPQGYYRLKVIDGQNTEEIMFNKK